MPVLSSMHPGNLLISLQTIEQNLSRNLIFPHNFRLFAQGCEKEERRSSSCALVVILQSFDDLLNVERWKGEVEVKISENLKDFAAILFAQNPEFVGEKRLALDSVRESLTVSQRFCEKRLKFNLMTECMTDMKNGRDLLFLILLHAF